MIPVWAKNLRPGDEVHVKGASMHGRAGQVGAVYEIPILPTTGLAIVFGGSARPGNGGLVGAGCCGMPGEWFDYEDLEPKS